MGLSKESCIPCQGGTPPLGPKEATDLLQNLQKEWAINSQGHLERAFLVKNFAKALHIANILGKIADEERHHPDLLVSYGILKVEIWTHKINGLTKSDFILAAKFDDATSSING